MIADINSNMSYSNCPLYQHGSSSPTTSLSKQSMRTNNSLISNYHRQPMVNTTSRYPTAFTNHSFTSNSNYINPQPQYYYQPWKPTSRPSNELMLSHETNTLPSYSHQYNTSIESGMPVDSSYRHRQLNAMYSFNQEKYHYPTSPPLSTSTSLTDSMYNTQPCVSNNQALTCEPNDHYRRSSANTSRSSSPSFHESFISRSPSPVNNKRYSCRLCSKRFTRPSSLTTHIYSHTGEKPFKCLVDGCGRKFSVVSNLRRHAKVHGNNPIISTSSSITYSL